MRFIQSSKKRHVGRHGSSQGREEACFLGPAAHSCAHRRQMRPRGRRIGHGPKNRREPPEGNDVVTGQHEGNECVGVVLSPAASSSEVICTVSYVPASTCPVLGQHRCYKWIVILNMLSRFMRPLDPPGSAICTFMRFSAARPLWGWETLGANGRDCAVG